MAGKKVFAPKQDPKDRVDLTQIGDMVVIVLTKLDGSVQTFTFDLECRQHELENAFKAMGAEVTFRFSR